MRGAQNACFMRNLGKGATFPTVSLPARGLWGPNFGISVPPHDIRARILCSAIFNIRVNAPETCSNCAETGSTFDFACWNISNDADVNRTAAEIMTGRRDLAPSDHTRWLSDEPDPRDLTPVSGWPDAHVAHINARQQARKR